MEAVVTATTRTSGWIGARRPLSETHAPRRSASRTPPIPGANTLGGNVKALQIHLFTSQRRRCAKLFPTTRFVSQRRQHGSKAFKTIEQPCRQNVPGQAPHQNLRRRRQTLAGNPRVKLGTLGNLSSSRLLKRAVATILGLLLYFAPLLGAAWFISHKRWNRMMHALHGNTSSSGSGDEPAASEGSQSSEALGSSQRPVGSSQRPPLPRWRAPPIRALLRKQGTAVPFRVQEGASQKPVSVFSRSG